MVTVFFVVARVFSSLLATSWYRCVSHPFLGEFEDFLSLEILEHCSYSAKPHTSWIMSDINLAYLVRHPWWWLCLGLLVFIVSLWHFLRLMSSKLYSHGCYFSMVTVAEARVLLFQVFFFLSSCF